MVNSRADLWRYRKGHYPLKHYPPPPTSKLQLRTPRERDGGDKDLAARQVVVRYWSRFSIGVRRRKLRRDGSINRIRSFALVNERFSSRNSGRVSNWRLCHHVARAQCLPAVSSRSILRSGCLLSFFVIFFVVQRLPSLLGSHNC